MNNIVRHKWAFLGIYLCLSGHVVKNIRFYINLWQPWALYIMEMYTDMPFHTKISHRKKVTINVKDSCSFKFFILKCS